MDDTVYELQYPILIFDSWGNVTVVYQPLILTTATWE